MIRFLSAAAGVALLLPGPLAAQDGPGRTITGTVVDSTSNKGIGEATLYLGRTAAAERTDKNGRFRVAAGAGNELVVRRAGYLPARAAIPGDAAGPIDLGTIRMRKTKTDADRAENDAHDQFLHPELAAFYQRKRELTQGLFFTPGDVEQSGARTAADLVRRARGFRNVCLAGRQGEIDCGDDSKRGTTYTGFRSGEEACVAAVWSNDGYLGAINDIPIADVLALEAYPRPAVTPSQFTRSKCETVVVWLRPAP